MVAIFRNAMTVSGGYHAVIGQDFKTVIMKHPVYQIYSCSKLAEVTLLMPSSVYNLWLVYLVYSNVLSYAGVNSY